MKVSFSHREEAAGLRGKARDYFVDVTVQLSEEEKAIIETRRLHKHGIRVGGEVRPSYAGGNPNVLPLRIGAFVVGIGGGVLFYQIGMLFVLIGVGMFIASFFMKREAEKASLGQNITLAWLLENNRFTVFAPDPLSAEQEEEHITEQLMEMKNFIMGNVKLGETRTIEI